MTKKNSSVRTLLAFVIVFSMVMPATYIVSLGSENGVELTSPGMNAESRAIVNMGDKFFEAWLEGKTHNTHVMFSSSDDFGRTWSQPERITKPDTVPLDVQMAIGANFLHLIWSDAVTKNVQTGYVSFDLASGIWSNPNTLRGEYASLAAHGRDVAIATVDGLMLTVYSSVDDGKTFDISKPMNELACSRPAVFLENGKISVAGAAGVRDPLTGKRSQQGIYFTCTKNPLIWPAQVKLADTSGSVRNLKMEKKGNEIKMTWTELTETSNLEYSMLAHQSGEFSQKVLMASKPIEFASETPSQTLDSRLPPKKWTFIVYLDADNNLNDFGVEDANEMEMIGSNDDLNIVVLMDGDSTFGYTKAYYIQQDADTATITSPTIPLANINSSWGTELNMGDPQTAIDFVNYVYSEYPAEHYLIDFWDHGGSWLYGMCSDDTNGDDFTMLEVRTIFETLRADTGKIKLFDVAGYDECLMSDVEVDYDEMPYIDYICNSEDSIGGDGWEYNIVLGHINSNLDMDGEEAAWWVFQSYVETYGTSGDVTTMSVINTSMFVSSLCPAINNLAQKGIHEISTYRTQLQTAANNAADWQGYSHQKDLIHFCQNIISGISSGAIHDAADAVITAGTSNPVGTQYGQPAWQHDRAIMIHNQNANENGITIYAASPPYSITYDSMTWIDTNWDEFYKVLWGSDASDPNTEPTVSITNPANGSFVVVNTIATITGTAADDGSVSRVDVGVHTQHWAIATGTTAWSYNWNTAGWAPGWYKIMARAYDGQDFSAVDVHDVQIIVDPTLPDLSIVPADVSFDNPTPNEGDTVTITATTWNLNSYPGAQTAGNATNPVNIGFYDGNPATGGTLIAIVNAVPSIIPINTSGTANTTWNTAGLAGYHNIYAVADPLYTINELTDANNSGIKSIVVAGYNVDLSCPQNTSVVQAGTSHTYQINVTNTGTSTDTITLTIDNPTGWRANFNNNPSTKSVPALESTTSKGKPVDGYHTFSEIEAELNATVAAHPDICQLYSIGTTWESRNMWVMKISDNVTVNETEPEVYMNGGIHAREWIGEEVVLYYMNWLVDNYGTDPQATWLVDNRQIYLSPCVNPDGFVYSQTLGDWRKNRRDNGDGSYGVDLNRNWNGSCNNDSDGDWGGAGTSHSPGDETYCGPSAFSEPETQAMRDFILAHNFQVTICYHSYGEELYWPWGYSTSVQAPDNAVLSAMGTALAAENGYSPMQSSFLYLTTGDTDDWTYGYSRYYLGRVMCAHTIELATSFQPPQSQITSICEANCLANIFATEASDNIYLDSPTFTHTPLPDTTDTTGPYTVSAVISTPNGLQPGATKLFWCRAGQAWNEVLMTNTAGDTWEGDIPGQPDGTWVNYYVETEDVNSHKSSEPKYTPFAYHDFFVGNDVVEYTVTLGTLEWRNVNFTVEAPVSAMPNDFAIIDVIGTSQNDPSKVDSVETVTTVMPGILLVNDGNSAITNYQAALDNKGYLYDVGTPASDIMLYPIVIWACDDSSTLSASDKSAIQTFLNAGGYLYINGEDIGYDIAGDGDGFYQNYLHANYLADNSDGTQINGVAGDEITDGMSNFAITGSYPDEISPNGASASTIFTYVDGSPGVTAGIKADTGAHKVVYIACEYFEGSDNQTNKDLLMEKILTWFSGAPRIVHTPLGDTEDTVGPYEVNAEITDNNPDPSTFEVRYSTDGSSYTPLLMSNTGGNNYAADIPGQPAGTDVYYYIYAADLEGHYAMHPKDANEMLPATMHQFHVGPDLESPVITHTPFTDTPQTTPYAVTATITDNMGLDLSSLHVQYRLNANPTFTQLAMSSTGTPDEYSADIPGQPVGTTIHYYIEATDSSAAHNYARHPTSGTHDFSITSQPTIIVIDDSAATTYEQYFYNALDALGYVYDTGTGSSTLTGHDIVIWHCDGTAFLSTDEQTALQNFMDAGGAVYMSAEEFGFSHGTTTLYQTYFGLTYVGDNAGAGSQNVIGITGDEIMDGLTIPIGGAGGGAQNNEYPDYFNANGATMMCTLNSYNVGSHRDSGTYRCVHTGFNFESINYADARSDLMYRILNWLTPDQPPIVNLQSPVGSEQILSGTVNITWVAGDDKPLPAGCVDLYYSDNAGSTWTPIASNLDNTGYYNWDTTTLSDGVSYMLRITVEDSAAQTGASQSTEFFSIDNTEDDRWYLQVESTNLGTNLDLDMKPSEASVQSTSVGVPGAGEIAVQTFASVYVASGDVDLVGSWAFSINAKVSSSAADGNLYAHVYADDGVTERLLFTTGYDDEFVGSFLTYHAFAWTYSVPAGMMIHAGEHVKARIMLHATAGAGSSTQYHYAYADVPVLGTVTGDYTQTLVSDDTREQIAEVAGSKTSKATILDEDFEGAWGPNGDNPPAGWTIEDHGSVPGTWNNNDWHNYDTAGVQGNVARVYYSPIENQDEWLITPTLNFGAYDNVNLTFWMDYQDYSVDTGDHGYVDISLNGGGSWTINVAHYEGADITGIQFYDISSQVAGQTNVKIRWRYLGNDDMWWYVDDVLVQGSTSTSLLEHKWKIDVPAGEAPYIFSLEGRRPNSADNDNFNFSYSTDNVSFTYMLAITSNTESTQTFTLPSSLTGTVYIKVVDTVRTAGATTISDVQLDQMFISSVGGSPSLTIGYDHQSVPSFIEPKLTQTSLPTYDIPVLLSPGWNFVSFPLLASGAPQTVLNDAAGDGLTTWSVVRWYDPNDASDHWKSYASFMPASLCDLTVVNNTMGLWLYITQVGDGYLTVQASQPTTTNINLKAGWNLVGYPSATPSLASATLPASADIVGVFNVTDPYKITDMAPTAVTMQSGKAYWVHCTADALWTVPW